MKRKLVYAAKAGKALKQAGGEGIRWKVDGVGDRRVTPSWTVSAGAVKHSAGQEQGEVPRKAEFPNSLLGASRARAMLT